MSLSLINIMNSDPEFGRISKKVEEIKKDKQNISSAAESYAQRYSQEIEEGTAKRAKLLAEGSSKGLSEAETLGQWGVFIPSKATPILNFLYFLLRESDNDAYYGKTHYAKRNQINEALANTGKLKYENDSRADLTETEADAILSQFITEQFPNSSNYRRQINSEFEKQQTNRPSDENTKDLKF